jgi:peptidyl-prolyl cis-trans isomerase SurA
LQSEEEHLESKYPAFKEQMAEFYSGSLYSKLIDREVINKSLDSLGQSNYFSEHRASFVQPARLEAKLIVADSKKTLTEVVDQLKHAPFVMNKKLADLNFALGAVTFKEPSGQILDEIYATLAKNADYQVEISGHRDESESDSLSEVRSAQVVKYLAKKGIASQRIIQKDEANLKPFSKTVKDKNARVSFRFLSSSTEDLVKRFNALKPKSVEVKEGYFKKGDSPIIDAIDWSIGSKTWETTGKFAIVEVKKIEPERLRSFDEARGLVIRGYQEKLEKEWLVKLRQQYPVVVNTAELEKILKN